MPVIRPLAPLDIEAVMHLDVATPEAPHWGRLTYEGFLEQNGAPPKQLFIAEQDDKLMGYTAGRIVAGICEMESIAVKPGARRSGIGTALLSALAGWARARGASRVELEVRAGNNSAISFYKHIGFRPDGLRAAYYQNPGEDALLMGLVLNPDSGV